MDALGSINLPPRKLLVRHLPDYYKMTSDKFDVMSQKDRSYSVGEIVLVGSEFSESFIGDTVFFYPLADEVDLKGIGTFLLVDEDHILMFLDKEEE